jgi:hypothetical protein
MKTMREMKHEAAAECRRLFQHWRMQPRARLPLGVDVDNQAGRASSTDHVRVRLSAAPEQQGRRTVRLRVVAANLGDAPCQDEHEARVRVDMTMDALPRLVLNLGERQAADLAPSQDLAMREVLRQLGVDHDRPRV